MEIPERFRHYNCSDYFGSEELTRGVWSHVEQLQFVFAADEVIERPDYGFLVIGRPGVEWPN